MILAAGKGTRLLPLTKLTPKVMLPVNGNPMIYYILQWLKSYGISSIGLNLHHLGDSIIAYLGDGSQFSVNIRYSHEDTLLGTAGGVKKLESFFRDTFILVYGDVLTDFNLSAMIDFHRKADAMATIALTSVTNPREKGIVAIDPAGKAISFIEKPDNPDKYDNLSNAGVYLLEPEIFSHIPEGRFYDFGFDVFPSLLAGHKPVYGYCIEPSAYLIDIGSQESYDRVNRDMRNGEVKIAYA